MEKIGKRRELNKGLGRRKEQCHFSSLSLGWFASFFALTLFPQQEAWSQIQKFLHLHPWGRELEKRRAFSKEKPQKTHFVKLIYILVKKRIYSNLVVTIIFTFSSFVSKVSIVGEFVNLFRIYVWAGHESFINIKTATLLLKREIRLKSFG